MRSSNAIREHNRSVDKISGSPGLRLGTFGEDEVEARYAEDSEDDSIAALLHGMGFASG